MLKIYQINSLDHDKVVQKCFAGNVYPTVDVSVHTQDENLNIEQKWSEGQTKM